MGHGSWVGQEHHCSLPPEELYVRLSPHTAQVINKHRFVFIAGFQLFGVDLSITVIMYNDHVGVGEVSTIGETSSQTDLPVLEDFQCFLAAKQGDFFIESPINFVTAVMWFLRKYQDGKYCTLPHLIEFIQLDYNSVFTLLQSENEIRVLVATFIKAYLNDVMEQLEGQIASAKIALARLASPQLYYVLSGNDFTLDINDPEFPKVVCMGNNPQKIQIYGAVLSLYVNRLLKIINKKNKLKSMLIFDEIPTLTTDIIPIIATGRSNKISTCMGIQDASQLRKDYGKENADVIMNIVGTVISGQVTGDSAKILSERIGRIMQDRESLSINSGDTSISKSKQLEAAVPASKIASLSSGEFVGTVADTPQQKIELKAFHCELKNDFSAIEAEEKPYKRIPIIRQVDQAMVMRNYHQIQEDVKNIVNSEMECLC